MTTNSSFILHPSSLIEELHLTLADPATLAGRARVARVRAELTIGRDDELRQIAALVAKRRHTLLVAGRGLGKSHLLRHLLRDSLPGPTLFLDDFKAMKPILRQLAEELHETGHLTQFTGEATEDLRRRIARWSITDLTQLVTSALADTDTFLVIDNLETLTPTGVPVLQALSQVCTIIAAARTDELGRVQEVIERFNTVELRPISDGHVRALLWALVDAAECSNPAMLETKVLSTAQGNPGAVVDAATRYAEGKITLRDIRQISNRRVQPTDITWVFLFFIAGIMAMRYVSRAMDSQTAYVLFGVLSAFGLILRTMIARFSR